MKSIKIFGLQFILSFCYLCTATGSSIEVKDADQSKVIAIVKKAKEFAKTNGIAKAIIEFKNSNDLFIGNYDGMFFVSPLHPELIGKNQFNYKDSTGALVVQEEINMAKAGGGWLKRRWRKISLNGNYQCRRIYIIPVASNYYIGSWYHYSPDKQGICPI